MSAEFTGVLGVAIFFAFITLTKTGRQLEGKIFFAKKYSLSGYLGGTALFIVLLTLSIGSITSSGFNPFIYFRF